MNKDTQTSFAKRLIKWYQKEQRALPFRESKDPYRVWLSEVILQQTQMGTGIKYYNLFIKNFPNIKSLAKSSEKKIYSLWQGLGYYNRAKNLHKSAKIITTKYNRVFPDNYDELIKLPGIGKYTASAISSICYNEKRLVVDANVFRVLSRFFGISKDISKSSSYSYFLNISEKIAQKTKDFGEYNESIMDFGGSVCLPKKPLCERCVFKKDCYAKKEKKTGVFPIKKRVIKIKKRFFNYIVFEDKERVLIKKRIKKDVWKNLYEFYLNENESESKPKIKGKNHKNYFRLISKDLAKLSHQVINVNFYRPVDRKYNLEKIREDLNMVIVKKNNLKNYAFPKVIDNYLKSES